MKKCAFAIISVVMLAVMLSCEHKELYNGIPHVVNARVIFDWQKAPDANPGIYVALFVSCRRRRGSTL